MNDSHKTNAIDATPNGLGFAATVAISKAMDSTKNKEERLALLDDFERLLSAERRFIMLTDKEREAMFKAGETVITPGMQERLSKCKSAEEEEVVYEEFARATYMLQCEWADYLHGFTDVKPFTEDVADDEIPAEKEKAVL